MKRIGTKSGKRNIFGQNEAVPVPKQGCTDTPPSRSQTVPLPIQAVPVPPNRMQSVPVPIQVVPVPVCPKCLDCCIFAYLSLNSYIDCIGTLLND